MHKTLFFSKANNIFSYVNGLLRLVVCCIIILATTASYAQQPFITTWKTDNPGTSNSTSITIPTTGTGYNYEVDWNNDGVYDQSGITGNVTHDFGVAGTYTIRIRGAFPRIYSTDDGDREKLLDVGQWGDIAWASMGNAFYRCSNLNISATDLPDLSGVTDMSGMFQSCTTLNGPDNIGNWNTSNVTNMRDLFLRASVFNQPLGNWNTSNVTNMIAMFAEATAFNQPIGNWNVSKVTYMIDTFHDATAFNQYLGGWSLKSVLSLGEMLSHSGLDCDHYSATLIGWNANPATPNGMFLGCDGLEYGTNAVDARVTLLLQKDWFFPGDAASGTDCSALPVTLISFTGKSKENGVLLTWETTSETNNAGFEIEKSANARTFEKIGFVDGGGDSKVRKTYHFRDTNPFPTNYYRLKQLDYDGKFEYSRIIPVKQPGEKIVIYPNPTTHNLYVRGLNNEQKLVIRNAEGKVVHRQQWSAGDAVKVDHLPDGPYFISVGGQTRKIIVAKQNP